ncbi:MAG: RimK family alpha-L-glutamate ligase, partial [Candidatus Nanohaloarchaea archaeon]
EVAVEAAEKLGYPVIMKTVQGGGGQGVMRATSEKELKPVMDTMKSFEQEICLQEYKEHEGTDNRVIIIGDYVTAYQRCSKGDDWRSNISEGGKRQKADLNQEIKQLARKSGRALGFDICGTDIINIDEGNFVLEVNGSFGISEEMNQLVGEDVILRMVERLHDRAMDKKKS